jgi:hypothetical protein
VAIVEKENAVKAGLSTCETVKRQNTRFDIAHCILPLGVTMLQNFFSTPQAIGIVIAALIAAIASVFAALYARRTQRCITEQQSALQQQVESLRDSFERSRSYNTFVRERIITFTDKVLESYSTLSSLTNVVILRSWMNMSHYSETEAKVHAELSSMQTQLGMLRKLNAISEESYEKSMRGIESVRATWIKMTDEVTLLSPHFRDKFPNEREFSESEYLDRWGKFKTSIWRSGEDILSTCASISLPK